MKPLILLITAVLLSVTLSAQEINKAYKANTITFLGLDYSGAVFIGSNGFKNAAELQLLPDAWNSLFITEPQKYNIQSAFRVKTEYKLNIVKERNSTVNYADRITDEQLPIPHLSEKDVKIMIKSYPDIQNSEVALVFIVDAYDKPTAKGYYHVVFFDTQSKTILLRYMVSGNASGGGLRNYWANSYYEVIKNAGRRYSSTAEFYRNYTE